MALNRGAIQRGDRQPVARLRRMLDTVSWVVLVLRPGLRRKADDYRQRRDDANLTPWTPPFLMLTISSSQARDAIYIDFECLKSDPPDPALLGVLIGAEGEQLEQLILDQQLAAAQRARPGRTRVEAAADAVETILNLARIGDSRIVGWSNFDRDRLVQIRPDLADAITARYVNALTIARPWRIRVHPSFAIEPENQFSPKHTLDKYAVLAGYPHARALVGATPATWIRHVRRQLKAASGSYRRTTRQTKRDWHKLLEYNRHDLLALRHIVLLASWELECWAAYQRMTFCVDEGSRRICFKVGSRSRKLDALLARRQAVRWAFVTAWNPGSLPRSDAENARRHADLVSRVQALGLETLPGEGIGEDAAWTPGKSLLILDISRRQAVSLGRQFGQLAVVVGRRGDRSRLVPTS